MERNDKLSRIFMGVAMLVLTSDLLSCQPAEAAAPLVVRLTFQTPLTVSFGEPIIGHYTITNTSDCDQICWVGSQLNGCLTPSDAIAGAVVPTSQAPLVHTEAGDQEIRVPAKDDHDGVHTGYFVINGWHEPGKHLLSLTLHFTYSAAHDSVSPGYGVHIDNNPVINQVFNTEVTVLPTNARQVRDTSEALRRSILKEEDLSRRQIVIMALFSMPETLVHDCWKELVYDSRTTKLEQTYIAQRLADISSPTSADLLAYQSWGAQPPVCMYPQVPQAALASLYNKADPALHQHIRDLYAQYGIQVADKIDIPQVDD